MLSQISFFTIINPINALTPSSMFTRKNIPTMCMAVNFVRHIAIGTFTRQTKRLSNRNVIIVFPPLLKMKYSEFDSDINGVAAATAHVNFVGKFAYFVGCIIEMWKHRVQVRPRIIIMPNDIKSEKAAIRVAVTLASFSFPAPSSCPTTIAIDCSHCNKNTIRNISNSIANI